MSLKERVEADLKEAMRSQNKDEIRALRGIKSQLLLAVTEKGATSELNEEAEISLLSKAVKQRQDSATLYQEQGRDDLAAIELAEISIISRYLPEQMSEEDLQQHLQQLVQELGASGPQDMGKVMGVANKQLKGRAQGGTIAKIVKTILTGG